MSTARSPNESFFDISEFDADVLERYASISIAFEARERVLLPLVPDDRRILVGESLGAPFVKDYDTMAGSHPTDWVPLLSQAPHAVLIAHVGRKWIGGAVVLCRAPIVDMLDGREELGLLWDLRVAPGFRGRGVGTSLFTSAERWMVTHGCFALRVETQDVNAAAARFYVQRGCSLQRAVPEAYAEAPDETQLIFEKPLAGA